MRVYALMGLSVWWVASACDDTVKDSGMGFTDTGPVTTETPTHDVDIQPLWDANCTDAGCHSDSDAAGGLSLVSGYDALVDVASPGGAELPLVSPGSSADSYLWHKLEGTQTSVTGGGGSQMPFGGTLTPDELTTIQAWIDGGAPR